MVAVGMVEVMVSMLPTPFMVSLLPTPFMVSLLPTPLSEDSLLHRFPFKLTEWSTSKTKYQVRPKMKTVDTMYNQDKEMIEYTVGNNEF